MASSEVEIYNQLLDYHTKLGRRRKIEDSGIIELLKKPKCEPLRAQEVFHPLLDAEDHIKKSLLPIVKLFGFTGMNEEAESLLADVAERKLNELCLQFRFSKARRLQNLETGFSSSLQHVLCLNGFQDPLVIKNHYDTKIKKPLCKIQQKLTSMLNNDKTTKRKRSSVNEIDKRSRQK